MSEEYNTNNWNELTDEQRKAVIFGVTEKLNTLNTLDSILPLEKELPKAENSTFKQRFNPKITNIQVDENDLGYYTAASWDKLSNAAQDAFKQRFKTADDFFAQYIKDCIRTESILPELKIDKEMVLNLFEMYTNLGELLDGLKKSIFYSKDEKFEKIYSDKVQKILDIANVLKRTPAKLNKELAPDNLNKRLLHGILGISTESSELVEILVGLLKDSNKEVDSINLHEECVGDIGWYTAILCDQYNLSWKQGLINNIEKLRIRFPEKFSIENATNRNLEAERKELEK